MKSPLKKRQQVNLDEIDKLGLQYEDASAEAKVADKTVEEIKEAIRHLAEEEGEDDKKHVYIKGRIFEGGYTRTEPRPYLNPEKLKKLLTPALLKKVLSVRKIEEVDEAAFVQLVESGKIPRSVVAKVSVVPPSDSTRFFLRRLKRAI